MPQGKATRSLDTGADNVAAAANNVAIGGFLLQVVFQKAFKAILGVLMCFQILVFLNALDINTPPNVVTFMRALKPIVSFDLMKKLAIVNTWVLEFDQRE